MRRILTLAAALALAFCAAFAVSACSSGSMSVKSADNSIHAESSGNPDGSGSGEIEIGEAEGICINHIIEKGSFHVTITADDGTVVFDDDISDNVANFIDVHGHFTVEISAESATGTVDIIPYDIAAMAMADDALEESPDLKEAVENAEE